MPTRFAITSGNWSNTAIWDNGALPVAGDFIFANGNTVTIDQNVNVGYISNGSSPVYVPDIATPAMTASNAPSGAASASTINSTFAGWLAFDQNTGTYWQATAATGWLRYDFPSAKIIRRYAILGSSIQTQNPRNWTFEGSNDGTTWTAVHTVTLGAAIAANTWYNSGVFANSTAYLYYRLNITLSGGINLMIPEFQMTESTSTAVGTGPNGTFNMSSAFNITCTHTNGIINQGTINTSPTLTISATTGSIAINSNVRGSSSLTSGHAVTISGTGHNITITGDVYGGFGTGIFGINRNASGTLNINGVLYAGGSAASSVGLYNTALGTGTITIVGALSTTGGAVGPALQNLAVCTINITGNIGGTLTNQNTSLFLNAGAATINITGTVSISTTGFNAVNGFNNISNSTITINGNVNGGSSSGTNNIGVASSLGAVNITGNVTGGGASTQHGVSVTGGTLTVNGTITGGTNCPGIFSTATSVTITGDIYASVTHPGVESTSNTTLVTFNGSAYGNGYIMPLAVKRMGIISPTSTVYRMANGSGVSTNFYAVGNPALGNPATSDVRNGVTYAGGALVGTLNVPPASSVAVGVPVDTSVGTAIISITDMGALLASYNV